MRLALSRANLNFATKMWSTYRPPTAFGGSVQAPVVGWGKLGCVEESLLMNSSSESLKLDCFPGVQGGEQHSHLSCYGFKPASQPCGPES